MVPSLIPGAFVASVRPALPVSDEAADALWVLAARLHRGEPHRFLALAKDERHWRLLVGLHAIAPALAAIGFAVGTRLSDGKTNRPVRALRQALANLGIPRGVWRDLVQHRLADAHGLFERSGSNALIAHLRLASGLGEPLPFEGPAADWIAQFQLDSISSTSWHLAIARWRLSPAMTTRVLREGLVRLDADTFMTFSEDELPVVAAWRDNLGKGASRATWSTLLARANAAEAAEERALTARDQRWDTAMDSRDFAGVQVTALGDGCALWREGLRMHHCVGDYAERCLSGMNRVFHLDTGDGSRGWTLALRADGEGGWDLDDLRGVNNVLPPPPLRFLAQEWATAYGEIFKSDPTALDDGRPEICMICREEWCNAHLVVSTDVDEGILGGVFYCAEKDLESDLQREIAELLLSGSAPPSHWPSEWTSLYTGLANTPKEELFELSEDEEPRWEAGDAYQDAWSDLNGRRILVRWIEEWAMEQHETRSKYTEVATAPGLSWAGWSVYAENPKAMLDCFNDAVARWFNPADGRASE